MFDYISSAEMLFCDNLSSAAVREDRISQCYSTCLYMYITILHDVVVRISIAPLTIVYAKAFYLFSPETQMTFVRDISEH